MVKVIMHGCNGKMGQTITNIVKADPEIEIVAGVDVSDHIKNEYPLFSKIADVNVEADAVIDFSNASAVDALLDWCEGNACSAVLNRTFRGAG